MFEATRLLKHLLVSSCSVLSQKKNRSFFLRCPSHQAGPGPGVQQRTQRMISNMVVFLQPPEASGRPRWGFAGHPGVFVAFDPQLWFVVASVRSWGISSTATMWPMTGASEFGGTRDPKHQLGLPGSLQLDGFILDSPRSCQITDWRVQEFLESICSRCTKRPSLVGRREGPAVGKTPREKLCREVL